MAIVIGAIAGCALFGLWIVLVSVQGRSSSDLPPTVRPTTALALATPTVGADGVQHVTTSISPIAIRPVFAPSPVTSAARVLSTATPTPQGVAAATGALATPHEPPAAAATAAVPPTSSPIGQATRMAPSPPALQSAHANDVADRIGQILRDMVGDGSATVVTTIDGAPLRVSHASGVSRVAASTIKLPILLEILRADVRGEIDLGQRYTIRQTDVVGGTGDLQRQVGRTLTFAEIVRLMIVRSDNVGTNVLLRQLGGGDARAGMARVNRLMAALGYSSTRVERTMLDTAAQQRGEENYVSSDDLASILDAARRNVLLSDVSPTISQRALALLRERGQHDRDWLGIRLAPGWSVAHINGTLDTVRNDAGIISGPAGREFVLVVCQDALTRPTLGEQHIADAAVRIQELLAHELP